MTGYTALYNAGDAGNVIIDWIVAMFVGLITQGQVLGIAIAIFIVVTLYLTLTGRLFHYIKGLTHTVSTIGGRK